MLALERVFIFLNQLFCMIAARRFIYPSVTLVLKSLCTGLVKWEKRFTYRWYCRCFQPGRRCHRETSVSALLLCQQNAAEKQSEQHCTEEAVSTPLPLLALPLKPTFLTWLLLANRRTEELLTARAVYLTPWWTKRGGKNISLAHQLILFFWDFRNFDHAPL